MTKGQYMCAIALVIAALCIGIGCVTHISLYAFIGAAISMSVAVVAEAGFEETISEMEEKSNGD